MQRPVPGRVKQRSDECRMKVRHLGSLTRNEFVRHRKTVRPLGGKGVRLMDLLVFSSSF